MNTAERIHKEITRYGVKAKGRSELLKHLEGKKLQSGEAIVAQCYMCLGYYADGRNDCKMPHCPLYPWMPYRNRKA